MRKIDRFVMTQGFHAHYGPIEPMAYIRLIGQHWEKHPIDMYIFENGPTEGTLTISVNGYHIETNAYVETTVIATVASMPIEKFWFKVDDYGDELVGTFLFPDEY